MRSTAATALLATCALGAVPERGQRQDASGRLAFEREFFVYPASARRDPFRPPADSGGALPVVEDLSLLGVVHAREPGRSVVLLAATGEHARAGPGPASGRTLRLRPGARAGKVRIVEIGLDRVLVAVEEPDGRVRSAEIEVPRRRPAGIQGEGS